MPHGLNETQVFAILAKRRRRLVIRLLQESTSPVSLSDLAARIARCESEAPSSADRRRIELNLHHVHLPKLEDAGVVSYDLQEETVSPEPNLHSLVRFLERVEEDDRPWSDARTNG